MKRSHIISLSAAILLGVFVFGGRAAQAASTTFPGVGAKGEIAKRSNFLWFTGTPKDTLVSDHTVTRFNTTTNTVDQTFNLGTTAKPYSIAVQGPTVWISDYSAARIFTINGSNVVTPLTVDATMASRGTRQVATDGPTVFVVGSGATSDTIIHMSTDGTVQKTLNVSTLQGGAGTRISGPLLYNSTTMYGFAVLIFSLQIGGENVLEVIRANDFSEVTSKPTPQQSQFTELAATSGPSGSNKGYLYSSQFDQPTVVWQQVGSGGTNLTDNVNFNTYISFLYSDLGGFENPVWMMEHTVAQRIDVVGAGCDLSTITNVANVAFSGTREDFLVDSGVAWITFDNGTLLKIDGLTAPPTGCAAPAPITIFNVKVTNIGAFSATVSWQTSVATSTNLVTRGLATSSATNGTTHVGQVTGLKSSTAYTLNLTSREPGYADAQATTSSFTTLAPYTVSVAPTGTQNVAQGSLATFTITMTPASDLVFASLSLATNPALASSTQTFSPTDIKPSQLSSTLTFTTDALAINTTYTVPVDVTCNTCNPVFTATVMPSFRVGSAAPACQLSLTPATQNVMSGIGASLQLQLTSLNGFNKTVNLTNISPSPAYPANKLSFTTYMGGGFPSQQTVTVDSSNVVQGSFRVQLHAKDPNSPVACDSPAVMVTVGPPDFTITAVPTTRTVSKNQFADYEFQVRPIGTFTGSVQVSIVVPSAGTAWPAGTYAPSSGSYSNAFGNMSVRVNTTTIPEGIYWAKVRAVSGSITHEIDPVELIVGPPRMCNDGVTADQTCSTTQQWCDFSVSPSLSENCVTNGLKCQYECAAPQTCNNTTGTCVGDTTPPVISPPQCLTTMNSATITWTTDEPANSVVLWRKSTEPPYPNVLSTDPLPTGATSHVVPISSLNPSTQYFVKVKSTNRQGYTAESAEIQCTTLATADTEAPVVLIRFPLLGSTIVGSTAVRADASDNNGVVRVEFNTTSPTGTTASINVDTTSPYEVNWDVAGLPSGTYRLTAKATDAANNIGLSPQVDVVVNNDTRKPVISNFLAIHNAPSQYTVTWTTDESATSWVYYCLEPASGGACTYDKREPVNGTAPSMSHRIVIDGLLLNRNYHLTPISCDSAGNCNNTKPF